jgi:Zn-dependent alcohol dehydrogenase
VSPNGLAWCRADTTSDDMTRAAVLREIGADLEILDVEVLAPQSHEITVQLAASGVCHSDLTTQDGTLARMPCPMVLGHEGAGVVTGVGPDVTKFAPGDHVILASAPKCGHCFWCLNSQSTLCEVIQLVGTGGLLDGTSRFRLEGAPLHQLCFTGTFTETTVVPDIAATLIPKEMPLVPASLLGCGVVTGYGAATRTATITPDTSVVVVGCGGVGLSAIQGAMVAGAGQIIAVDISEAKLELAQRFGATHVVVSNGVESIRKVRALTGHRGADVAIDATGIMSVIAEMIAMTRRGGECVFVGMPGFGEIFPLDLQKLLISSQRTFKGCVYGAIDIDVDVPMMVQDYLDGKLLLDELIGRKIALDDVNDALRSLSTGALARSVIEF